MLASRETKATDCDKAEEHEGQTSHVDRGSTEAREEKPTNHAADDVASRKTNVQIKRCDRTEACSFQKHDAVTEDSVTAKDLGGPNDTVLVRC